MLATAVAITVLSLEVPPPHWNLSLQLPMTGVMRVHRDTSNDPNFANVHNGAKENQWQVLGLGLERILDGGWLIGTELSAWAHLDSARVPILAAIRAGARRAFPLNARSYLALEASVGPEYISKTYDLIGSNRWAGQHTFLVSGRLAAGVSMRIGSSWDLGLRTRFDGALALARSGDEVWSDGDGAYYLANRTGHMSAAMDIVIGFQ